MPLFKFYILWMAVSDFSWLAVVQTPLTKAHNRQFLGFLRQSISKPKCLSCALTTQTLGAFGNKRLDVLCFSWPEPAGL